MFGLTIVSVLFTGAGYGYLGPSLRLRPIGCVSWRRECHLHCDAGHPFGA